MGTELGLNGWAGFGETEGEEGAFYIREKTCPKAQRQDSHRYGRDRASEKGLYSRNRVRKDRMGLLDGTLASGTRGW